MPHYRRLVTRGTNCCTGNLSVCVWYVRNRAETPAVGDAIRMLRFSTGGGEVRVNKRREKRKLTCKKKMNM
jgi:hypothetical protein